MKRSFFVVFCCFLFLLTACNSDAELKPVSEEEQVELESFIYEYRNLLTEAYNQYNFSLVEDYFVPNSHYYHYQRQTIGKNSTERIKEQIDTITLTDVKQDEQNDYHVFVTETVKVTDPVKGETIEENNINYIIMIHRDEFKVIDARTQSNK